jgi:uncharacterized protein YqgC (DUF456 family)
MISGLAVDELPVLVFFVAFIVIALVVFQAGYRLGRWWQSRTPDEKEGLTGMLVGSILGTLAFLLAVTMGMSSDRFDTRRAIIVDEANAIGTTYLRAGYLPQPQSAESRALLREYARLRVVSDDTSELDAAIARSVAIHRELWAIAEDLAIETPTSEMLALYVDSLNELIDIHTTRFVAGVYARVPETVLYLLIIGALVAIGAVGYNAGLTRRRSLLSAVLLVVALGAVVTLVVDLDRPRDGIIRVNQQALIDLVEQLHGEIP